MTAILPLITGILLLSLSLVALRLFRGPTLADRAVAGDQITIHVIALIAIHSLNTNQPILLDLLIVTAIVGFATITVIGVYIERIARGKARGNTAGGHNA